MDMGKALAAMAKWAALVTIKSCPPGYRVVVIVVDEDGEWLGLGSNSVETDVQAILQAATDQRGRVSYGQKAEKEDSTS